MERQRLEILLDSAVSVAVHNTVAANRFLEKLMKLDDSSWSDSTKHGVGSVVLIANPKKSVAGGSGKLFNNFIKNKQLTDYIGQNEKFVFPDDENYHDAVLKVITFKETFGNLRTDLRDRTCISCC